MDWFDYVGGTLLWGGGVWQIVAITLKLCGVIAWSWWLVMIPLLALAGLFTVLGWIALWNLSQIKF